MPRPSAIKPVKGKKANIHMVLVADAGWGKTVFAGSGERVLFLVCDPEGTLSASSLGSTADEWEIKTTKDLEEAYKWLRDEGHEEYDWVVIDTVGGAQRILQRSALDAAVRAAPGKQDPDVPSIAVHQKAQIQIIKFIMMFNDLPMHTLFTAHPMHLEDDEGETYILPYVHGGKGEVAQQALGHFNVAGYGVNQEVGDKVVRRIYFTHNNGLRGKDRFHKLGRYRDSLDLATMQDIIEAPRATTKKAAARRPATAK